MPLQGWMRRDSATSRRSTMRRRRSWRRSVRDMNDSHFKAYLCLPCTKMRCENYVKILKRRTPRSRSTRLMWKTCKEIYKIYEDNLTTRRWSCRRWTSDMNMPYNMAAVCRSSWTLQELQKWLHMAVMAHATTCLTVTTSTVAVVISGSARLVCHESVLEVYRTEGNRSEFLHVPGTIQHGNHMSDTAGTLGWK